VSHVTPDQNSFNGGELSRRMRGRRDQAIYGIGVGTMLGWLPTLQGPAETAPGTIMEAVTRAPVSRAIPFRFNRTQEYVIEATAGKLRFYTNEGRIETSPGVAYEIDAPWTVDQLDEVNWCQTNDVLFLYHKDVQTRALRRLSAVTFELATVTYIGGPFERRNRDQALTVSASNVVGTVELEASAALFAANDVGGLFRMEASDLGTIPVWQPGITVAAGELRQSSIGVIYQALAAGRTGTNEPVHPEGVEYDGMATGTDINANAAGGIQWLYLHDRFGLLRITGFTSATIVTAEVLRRLPFTVSGGQSYDPVSPYNPYEPTEFDPGTYEWTPPAGAAGYTPGCWRWQFGSFSNRLGWPRCGTIWLNRHVVGAGPRVHASVIDGFDDFSPLNELGDPSRDMSFTEALREPDDVLWLVDDEDLLFGTAKAEYRLGAASASGGVGPGNTRFARQTRIGAHATMPVSCDGRVVFIQAARAKLHEFAYGLERDRFETPDLTRFAEHIGTPGLRELAWQAEPGRLLWAVRDDGVLACALYEPKEQALGFARRVLGGGLKATSIASIVGSDGRFDQLWITATNAAGTQGYMLRMARVRLEDEVVTDYVMADAAIASGGAGSVTAAWFANQAVDVTIDGVPFRLAGDAAGLVTLPEGAASAASIIAGLAFNAKLELLPLEAGGDNGPAAGKLQRQVKVALELLDARGLKVSVGGAEEQAVEPSIPGLTIDAVVPASSGWHWLDVAGNQGRAPTTIIRRDLPVAATLLTVKEEKAVQGHGGRP
jgi:hypothetical protein